MPPKVRTPAASVPADTAVPWWGRMSSALAPVLLIGGWTLAATRQPGGFDSVSGTISALAALDATDRWIMTVGIAGTGVCHLVTAASLAPAATAGRRALGLGGVATLAVAAFPLPAGGGSSAAHAASAVASFALLSAWAPLARRHGEGVAWGLRPRVAVVAGAVLGALTVGFFATAVGDAGQVGLVERLAAGAQALWPAAVVVSVAASTRRAAGQAKA